MNIDHIAIWTLDIDRLKDFYTTFFNGRSNAKYVNVKKQFESYFIEFDAGARLEIMARADVTESASETSTQYLGLTHLAFGVQSRAVVDAQAARLKASGFAILSGPRVTGDGYYEFETEDPDGNRVEVTCVHIAG